MSDQPDGSGRNWVSRPRERGADRRAIRADRRARRRPRSMGGSPDDAARQAESGNVQGGFFTTQGLPKR
jgi:hypothetical protein